MTKSHLLVGAAAFAVAISVSQPAFAQDTAAECVDANNNGICDSDENTERSIVVTGSRISRPTLDSSVPLTSVDVGELTDTGDVSLGDALNDLPSLRSTFSQGNSDGINLRAQGGVSSRGDRGNVFVAGTFGRNFADGRGNIAISAEYAEQTPLYFTDRDALTGAYSGRCQWQLTDNTVGEPAAGDGIPDNTFLCGIKNASISDGGTLGAIDPSSAAQRRYLRFDSNGNIVIDTPDASYSAAGSGNQQGGTGSTLRNTGQLAAGLKRYAINLLAHYDVSDAFRPYVEAKYVHVDARQEGQPSFFQGSIPGFFGGGSNLRCDNPFLTSQAFSTLASYGVCNTTPDATPFAISRFNVDFGGRGELHDRDTFRVVGGVEGTFNDDWTYDVSVNYGHLKTKMRSLNNLKLFDLDGNPDGFLLALDATRNEPGGT